jgi:hypothetical protein
MSTNLTEFYDGKPSYTVSIMEFTGVKVARETQYFADPFPAGHYPPWVILGGGVDPNLSVTGNGGPYQR